MSKPSFIYGTAWKKDSTEGLVAMALKSGFRAIDTANQAKHYSEAPVGQAWSASGIPRNELWLQSKFTSVNGQDHRLPYDPEAPLAQQVHQSFTSSLEHLRTDYLDSYLLHGPYNHPSLGHEDFEVWGAMEELHRTGRARAIGISNVNLQQLEMLWKRASIKPSFVQNRCYANRGWDWHVRDFCKKHNIAYQGFSLLTANPQVLQHQETIDLARKYGVGPAQIVFRYSQQIGMIPLTGTSNQEHMLQDLAASTFDLDKDELRLIEALALNA